MTNFYSRTVLLALAAFVSNLYCSSGEASIHPSSRICRTIYGATANAGSVCASVKRTSKRIDLTRIEFVGNHAIDGGMGSSGNVAPIRFRRGTASELCRLFNGRSEAVKVEVFHANGVSIPGSNRGIAASAPPITSYDEVACRR